MILTSVRVQVFVLSLPAFNWFRAAAGPQRTYHTCELIGGRQMISIGGHLLNSDHKPAPGDHTADPWTKGIGIFDMTDLTWVSGYKADAMPYEQSGMIKQYYQSNPKTPTWSNSALAKIFAARKPSSSGTATASSTPAPNHDTNVGAIAGGVVGGVVGLCAISALVVFLFWRRRRNRNGPQAPGKSVEETTKYTPMGEMSAENELAPPRTHELGADPARPSINDRPELDVSRP